MTPINVYGIGVLQIPDKEASVDLRGGIYFNGNTGNLGNMHERQKRSSCSWGNQIFMEAEQVMTLENSYTSTALQVRNGKASGDLGVEMYCNSCQGYMNTGQGTSSLNSTMDDIAEIVSYVQ